MTITVSVHSIIDAIVDDIIEIAVDAFSLPVLLLIIVAIYSAGCYAGKYILKKIEVLCNEKNWSFDINDKKMTSPLLSRLGLDLDAYYSWKMMAAFVVYFGSLYCAVIYAPTLIFYFGWWSSILNLFTGKSIVFVVYILAWVVLLDAHFIQIHKMNEYVSKSSIFIKEILADIWLIGLIVLSVYIIKISNSYKENYAFMSNTFLLDRYKKIYHLNFDNDCEVAERSSHLSKVKGYQIDKEYRFCEWCEEWEDEVMSDNYYFRK